MKGILLSLGLIIYLFLAYAHFYNLIKAQNLTPPGNQNTLNFGSAPKKLTYISLGDSLTAGTGASSLSDTYPYLLSQSLASKGYTVKLINLGIPGATVDDIANKELPELTGSKPDLITLLVGVNDIHNFKSLASFKDSYTRIATQLKSLNTKVVLISIPFLGYSTSLLPPYSLLANLRTQQFNSVISELASQNNFEYIDLYSGIKKRFKDKNLYASDLFHPSSGGYRIIFQYIDANWNP